jgi:hypothetical protein
MVRSRMLRFCTDVTDKDEPEFTVELNGMTMAARALKCSSTSKDARCKAVSPCCGEYSATRPSHLSVSIVIKAFASTFLLYCGLKNSACREVTHDRRSLLLHLGRT